MTTDTAAFIRAHLPIVPVPSVPEIRLHRAGPSSGLRRFSSSDADRGAPYWAYFWPGGLALARHLLDHPAGVAGRRVLDLGAGSGLVAIAAAKAGARHVIAAETDHMGRAALALNAGANGVALEIVAADLTGGPPPPVDIVLAGDLFYERTLAHRVTGFLERCQEAGRDVLIGDPDRAFLPRERLRRLATYQVVEVGGSANGPRIESHVYRFAPSRSNPLESRV